MERPEIYLPSTCNYVAAFLTLKCNLSCLYCLNSFNGNIGPFDTMSEQEWAQSLNRLRMPSHLPITLQGGEPTFHPDFYKIVRGIRQETNIDLLTNLQFDVDEFMFYIPPERLKRDSPYASIRVSYHPESMALDSVIEKVRVMLDHGYSIGIWGISHPLQIFQIERASKKCSAAGIDFRFKEFMGIYKGEVFGRYKYPSGINNSNRKRMFCRTSELLIGTTGHAYKCHSDLYSNENEIGHIFDADFQFLYKPRKCHKYGFCHPCDIKVKNNRFQEFGHTSVSIQKKPVFQENDMCEEVT